MIWFFTPYDKDKKLLNAINRYFELVTHTDDWVVISDGDTAFLNADFGNIIERYTQNFPDTGLFTCYASRCHYKIQVPDGVNMFSDSILYHKTIAVKQAVICRNQVLEINRKVAGHLMVIRKGVWDRIKDEVFSKARGKDILGIDSKISYAVLEAGLKIQLMKELYIFHYCRLSEGFGYDEHLK